MSEQTKVPTKPDDEKPAEDPAPSTTHDGELERDMTWRAGFAATSQYL